ncbi:septal ring lytic transglycosylase RlpA family protein [Rufibacter psychrotolerans]|uniref:septal ring lytic transglycosylase RlpA family protein n=1 Tax=Rufibacter psychrotolerans TaxID=2812556 RepID=UPI0019675F58|nr:septal ring lytic transglycosylase RlpA family protein [Rufibacter sp. SYSU D00308]
MGKLKIYNALTVLFIFFISFAPAAFGQEVGDKQNGLASWYGAKYHGRPTSSGEIYNRHKLTAAHNELPLGSKVKVTNLATGESVVVRINDRGPFRGARIIDLSEAAARKIHYRKDGLADVTVEVVELPEAFLASRAKARAEQAAKEEALALAKAEAIKEAAETPKATAPPTPATATATNPTPITPSLAQTQVYVVQAGAFGNLAYATAQVEKLRKLYQKMPIVLVEETVNGQKVHRILAGRFVSKTTAEQARQDLGKKGFQGLVRVAVEPAPLASSL